MNGTLSHCIIEHIIRINSGHLKQENNLLEDIENSQANMKAGEPDLENGWKKARYIAGMTAVDPTGENVTGSQQLVLLLFLPHPH